MLGDRRHRGTLFSSGEKILTRPSKGSGPALGEYDRNAIEAPVVASFSDEIEYRLVRTDELEVPPGGLVTITRSEEVQHEVTITVDVAVQGAISLDLLNWLRAEVGAQYQRRKGRARRETKVSETEITLDGNLATHYQVSWYDRIQKGTVRYHLDSGDENHHLFEVKEGDLLRAVPIDSSPTGSREE